MSFLSRLRDYFRAVLWLYDVCHYEKIYIDKCKRIWPNWLGSPKEFFTFESIEALMENVDSESRKILLNFIANLTVDLNNRPLNFLIRYPECSAENFEKYSEYQNIDKPEYIQKGLPEPLEEAAVYYHHGMRFLPDSVKNYVKDKIFIDGGAWIGDSTLVFQTYSPKKVLAFDISLENAKVFHDIMKKNDISDDKVQLILKGLGDKLEQKNVKDGEGSITTFDENGDTNVEIITLDSCKEADGTVGWIKIDLEGYGLPAVKGMVETIKRDRPVLTLAVYHCAEELFGIKKMLESLDLNYKIMFRSLRFDGYHELTLIAYPAELDQV